MSTATAPKDGATYTPTIGSFLGAELLRIRSRRFVKLAVLGLAAVFVLVAVINILQSAKASQSQIDRIVASCESFTGYIDDDGNPIPPPDGAGGVSAADAAAAPPCTIREAVNQDGYNELPVLSQPPALTSDIPEEVLGVGLGVAVLGFILGCTVGGADWSQKTMAALLFWEPRRSRVFLVKLAALLASLVAILVVAQAVWVLIKTGIVATNGYGDVGFGSVLDDTLTNVGRSLVLVLTMGALAYGLASFTRNTGAALGVGFVYFAIFELFVNGLLPRLAPFTLTMNIGALFTPGGLHEEMGSRVVNISSLQGGLVLAVYAVVVCLFGLELFRRRDVS